MHGEDGAWLPITDFWVHKTGERKGKPMSRCPACTRAQRGRDPYSGLVPIHRVWFVFEELSFRLGKAETCRRLGTSDNIYFRNRKHAYKMMQRRTARKAMVLLRQLRNEGIARHKDSINHGAAVRGHRERVPIERFEFNGKDDLGNELKRKSRAFNSH